MRGDRISVLEAAYHLGDPEPEWLGRVVDSLSSCLDRGSSLVAYGYDFSDPARPRVDPVIDHGMPPGWADAALPAHLAMPHEQRMVMYRSGPCTTTRAVFGKLRERYVVSDRMRAAFGVQDFLVITAANPNDTGCCWCRRRIASTSRVAKRRPGRSSPRTSPSAVAYAPASRTTSPRCRTAVTPCSSQAES